MLKTRQWLFYFDLFLLRENSNFAKLIKILE